MPENRELNVGGLLISVAQPYAEGHPLTENEARVLNQTYNENVRNNLNAKVKAAVKENGGDPLSDDGLAALAPALVEYAANYTFATPGSGPARRVVDPVEKEAMRLAREYVKAHLAKDGRKPSDVTKEALDAAIADVASREGVLKAAKKAVADRAKLFDGDELQLDISSAA